MHSYRPLGYGYLRIFKSKALLSAVEKIPPDLWQLSIAELTAQISRLTKVDERLKMRFWSTIVTGFVQGIRSNLLYSGICSYTNFYNHFLPNKYKLVWLLTPESEHLLNLDLLEGQALVNLLQILNLKTKNDIGEPNITNIREIIKAVEIVMRCRSQNL